MPQQVRTRKQGTLNINAFSTKFVQNLGRGYIYRELMLRFVGTMTWAAAASNAAATMGRGDEWAAISKIEVIANGTDVIRSFSGPVLRMLNRNIWNNTPRVSIQMGDGATANPFFDSTLIIPFWQPLSAKPMDTALDSRQVSDLRLEVTTDANTAVNTAAANTAIAASIVVCSLESFGIKGTFSDFRIYQMTQAVPGTNPALQIVLPVNTLYRGFLVNYAASALATGADIPPTFSAAGATTAGIDNIQLASGNNIFRDLPNRVIQDWQRGRMGWIRPLAPGAANASLPSSTADGGAGTTTSAMPYANCMKSENLDEDAWTWLDLVHDGYLGEGIDSAGYSELNMFLNVVGAGFLTIIPFAIYPIRGAEVAAAA